MSLPGQINECPKQVLHLSRGGLVPIPRGLGRTVDPTAAGGTLVAGSLLEEDLSYAHLYLPPGSNKFGKH